MLQRLGLPDEAVATVRWEDLDRRVADDLTCLYVPHVTEPVGAELVRFHGMALLAACATSARGTASRRTRA